MEEAGEGPLVYLMPWTHRREDVLRIAVSDRQQDFISGQSVAEFLADDDEHPTFASYAICHESAVVGVVCIGREPDHGATKRWIPLLVVDRKHQGKGYARAAMNCVIADRRERGDCRLLGLSCAPDNIAAIRLYESLGFERRGTNANGEVEMWLRLDGL